MADKGEVLRRIGRVLQILRRTGPTHRLIVEEVEDIEREVEIIQKQFADICDSYMANQLANRHRARFLRRVK